MQLLYPSFLWAFLLLAIPVIIHLFRFRRYKTIFFSNVRFLKAVQQESTSRNRLKHLLVLACRLLAWSALIMAFAQPFIAASKAQSASGKNYISIFIDNSFSMNRLSENFTLLDKAKQLAVEIAKNFDEQDRFQLLTNNFSGSENRLLSKDELLAAIDEVSFSSSSKSVDAIAKRQSEVLALEGSSKRTAFLISDFQQSMLGNGAFQDSMFTLNLVPLEAPTSSNIAIDTCFFTEPFQMVGKNIALAVKVRNYGTENAENIALSLMLNGQLKSTITLNIEAGSSVIDTVSFAAEKEGWNEVQLSIGEDAVAFDNTFYLSFNAVATWRVLSLSEYESNKYIHAVFGKSHQFVLEEALVGKPITNMEQFALVALCNVKVISTELAAQLSNYIAEGGTVVVFPPFDAEKDSYNKFLLSNGALQIDGVSEVPTIAANINLLQNIFRDVFEKTPENMRYPAVNKYVVFSRAISTTREDILKTKEGDLLVARFTNGNGSLYVSAVAADAQASELPVSAIFAPMLFKMAVLGNVNTSWVFTIGNRTACSIGAVAGKENVFKLKGQNTEIIPQQFTSNSTTLVSPGDEIKTGGFYKLLQAGNDSALAILAANYNRAESNMQFSTTADLKKTYEYATNVNILSGAFTASGKKLADAVHAKPLWRYFLLAALFFLLIETLLLRFWKTEQFAKAT